MRYRLRLDRLEQLLSRSQISQNHWAMRLGLSRGHWSDLRSGRHPYPSPRTRQRMTEVFGVAEHDLFEPESTGRDAEFDFRLAIAARFEITAELGQGGMGTVYLANDLTLGRVVALKMVAAEAVAGIGADQLLLEIALTSRLAHPNILPLFDAGQRAGSPFYVMPLVRGGSLGARVRQRGALPLAEVQSLLRGVASGLAHAHEHSVLHCDVKPENILVQGHHAWVMDFGIARKLHSEAAEWPWTRNELDFSAGTPAYVSPEQAAGDPNLDARSDIYSLACVAYEMLAGRTPFRGETTQQVVSLRFHEPATPLDRVAPHVPPAVAEVIARAMSLDPARRPSTPIAFVEELEAASQSTTPARAIAAVGHRAMSRVRHQVAGPQPAREKPVAVIEWISSIRQDVVYAMRQRLRTPALSLMALLTLGLGVGLTTAVFAVLNAVLLRPLPFPEPQRLVSLQSVDSSGSAFGWVSSANWGDWNDDNRTLESSAIHRSDRVSVVMGGTAMRAAASSVSPDFFRVLRAQFLLGRGVTGADTVERRLVATVSEGFWRRSLDAKPLDELSIQVNGFTYAVTGVVASRHVFPEGTEIWLLGRPRRVGGAERNNINFAAIGRLAEATSVDAARTDLSTIAHRIRAEDPVALYSWGVGVEPLADYLVGDTSDVLGLLMGAVGLVLLIACANLASANLAQGAARGREMAVRAALGADGRRLVRQVLVDHVTMALAGGALGVLLAWTLTRSASLLATAQLPRTGEIQIDTWVMAFALLVSAATGILTGLLPALRASRAAPGAAMQGGTRGSVAGGRGLPGRVFVAAEVAMALMLVIGAGLLVKSLNTVLGRSLGYETANVVVAEVTLGGPRYNADSVAVLNYWERLRQGLAALPGSRGAGLINWVPMVMGGTGFIEVEGFEPRGDGAGYRVVSEGFFETLGIPLRAGRVFDATDLANGPRVVVVNQRFADRYWPGQSALGRRVRALSMEPGAAGGPPPWLTIVGVVGDARLFGYEDDGQADMYVLHRQLPAWRIRTMSAVVRGSGAPAAFLRTVREQVSAIDAGIPADLAFLDSHAARVTATRRFTMGALSVFGGFALVLAAIGVYGVLSFAMAQRTREMAVRAALGADRGSLQRLVLGSGARVVGAGVLTGLVGAWYLSRLAEAMLFEVAPRDLSVFALATLTIGVVGLAAAAIPARRASRVEPMEALRED